jgi:WS/DGAT/MGAT family acyltransferase
MFFKTHHCLMDGEAGTGLSEVLSDVSPDATGPVHVPEGFNEAVPVPPTERQVLANLWAHGWNRSARAAHYLREAATGALSSIVRRRHAFDPPTPAEVPRVSFNGAVGGRRALSYVSIPFDTVKSIRKHLDVTVNDVVLEIVGSTLRGYLEDRGERPERALVACVPVSLRKAGDKHLDNQITNMAVSLATDLPGPVDRLMHIHRSARRSREKLSAGPSDAFTAVGESLAPFAAHALMQITASETALRNMPLLGNLVVSNVRGSPVPLYTAGAKVEVMVPMSMVEAGQGLNVTVISYTGRLDFGFTVDPDLVPDPWSLADRVPIALAELEEDVARTLGRRRSTPG